MDYDEPDCAETDGKALELFKANKYDVVFMDIGLPDMDGITVTGNIRNYENKNNKKPFPILGITAYALDEAKEKCLTAGMNEVVNKLITLEIIDDFFNTCMH